MAFHSLAKDKIKIVLLENIHPNAAKVFNESNYHQVIEIKQALNEAETIELLQDAHFVGIRSRTQLNEKILNSCKKLTAIGCFCIGSDQVDLKAAAKLAIPVFNAPYSNTRSVAELVIGEMICLMRGIFIKNKASHQGQWNKSATGSYEVRGKTLGIVGYGHIGSQVSVLAEQFGLKIIFYDIENKLPLGNASQVSSLVQLLKQADIVTLHVPKGESTKNLINDLALSQMKQEAILINLARGDVIDLVALKKHLDDGKFNGVSLDVFPVEPASNQDPFELNLQDIDRVVLTPHIGGSTQEAQENIAIEVSQKLIKYSDNGSTVTALNFPEVSLPARENASRILHVHENRPGLMNAINAALAQASINILGQHLQTNSDFGFVVIDLETTDAKEALSLLKQIDGTIKARLVHNAQ